MSRTSAAPTRPPIPEVPERVPAGELPEQGLTPERNSLVWYLELLWEQRRPIARTALYGLLASTVLAFLIPVRFEATGRLMPPDNGPSGGLALAAAALTGSVGGLGNMAGEMLGLKSSSEVFVGVLSSRTVQDKLIEQFDLRRLYGDSRMEDARRDLEEHTGISVDPKSQIITIIVTDHDAKRAAAMCQAYIEQLNHLVADLSTSSARRLSRAFACPGHAALHGPRAHSHRGGG